MAHVCSEMGVTYTNQVKGLAKCSRLRYTVFMQNIAFAPFGDVKVSTGADVA